MSLDLKSDHLLYHGSYCEVCEPDLNLCKKYKDFGQGFYVTSDLEQAKRFARLSLRKAKENGIVDPAQDYGFVSCFQYLISSEDRIKIFEDADADWLHCVVGHRKKGSFPEMVQTMELFDIIGGKIANDATNATILTYMAGTLGEIGSEQADNICISLLLPGRLRDQYCFRTSQAIGHLIHQETIKV